jgi:hypothetical protein
MKRTILFFILLLPFFYANAQINVDGLDVNSEEDLEYIQIVGASRLNGQVVITIDYGQKSKLFKPSVIKGPNGKSKVFNSMMGALNFFNSNGWEYINSYAITVGSSNVYHYLLKRKE